MLQVGIRELSRNTAEVLAKVKTGQVVEITDHGHLVAVLSAPPAQRVAELDREELIKSGMLIAGNGRGVADWSPLPGLPGQRPLSEALAEMRSEERF